MLSDLDEIFGFIIFLIVSPPYFILILRLDLLCNFPILSSLELVCLELTDTDTHHLRLTRFNGSDPVASSPFIQGG
jgi:hypothetical protein